MSGFIKPLQAILEKKGNDPGVVLAEMAKGLEMAGAQFLVITCNTANLSQALGKNTKIGILASPAIQQIALFEKTFEQYDLSLTYPTSEEQESLLAVIRSVKAETLSKTEQNTYQQIAKNPHDNQGIKGLIVACTELSLLPSPNVAVLTLPYLIQSPEGAKELTLGEVGKELTENTLRDAGVRIISWSYSGFRVLSNSKRPIKTLDDLKGLVIRVPKNEIMISTYNSWGVNPSPLAWSETFPALQQKVVDGQDTPYITIATMKFDEVQKYITNIRYLFNLEPLIMSEQVFQKQSPEVQQAILDAGLEATEYSFQYLLDTEARIKEDLITAGMEITEPANNKKEWIEAATTQVWPAYYDVIGGKERLDEI